MNQDEAQRPDGRREETVDANEGPDQYQIIGHEGIAVTSDEVRKLIGDGSLGPEILVRRDPDGVPFALGTSPAFCHDFSTRGMRSAEEVPRPVAMAVPSAGIEAPVASVAIPGGKACPACGQMNYPGASMCGCGRQFEQKSCPGCGKTNLAGALRCDCGHGFDPRFAGLASDPSQASPRATSAEISFGQAAKIGLVAGVIYGILYLVIGDSQKGRMIAFAIVFFPSVMAIKPVEKKMASGAAFVAGALVSALIGAALRGK
jgi:hypothetical protein